MSANQYNGNTVLTSDPSNAENAPVLSKSCHKSQQADSIVCPWLSLSVQGQGFNESVFQIFFATMSVEKDKIVEYILTFLYFLKLF